ncbi:MAG: hypothetical protein PHX14_09270 [Syntrophomonadaceae bacterium]|nr:hypothetical protein [Syntrophomonadaceae bacterium]
MSTNSQLSAEQKQQALIIQLLDQRDSKACWQSIIEYLGSMVYQADPASLHRATVNLDRFLAESAWNLWQDYPASVTTTARTLQAWWAMQAPGGCAVLVLDALSLRELPLILQYGKEQGIEPLQAVVTGSEIPTETDAFAHALGASSRASLKNNGTGSSFILGGAAAYSDVLSAPFEDCLGEIPPLKNLVVWHTWLDRQIHEHRREPDELIRLVHKELSSPGFWQLLQRLRQGRKLIVTSDHGYANCRLFASSETNGPAKEIMARIFGQTRSCPAQLDFPGGFMPPLALTMNNHHVVLGQRRWTVAGGYPHMTHGGLSLLEALVPFIEYAEV